MLCTGTCLSKDSRCGTDIDNPGRGIHGIRIGNWRAHAPSDAIRFCSELSQSHRRISGAGRAVHIQTDLGD